MVDIMPHELLHHFFNFAIGDQSNEGVSIFHESDRVEGIIIRVGGGGTGLDKIHSLESENKTMSLREHGLGKHFEFSHCFDKSHYV